jgi:hypothetical protein
MAPLGHNLAIGQGEDVPGSLGQVHIVAHHDDRFVLRHQPVKKLDDCLGCLRVKIAGGFIRRQNRRIVG